MHHDREAGHESMMLTATGLSHAYGGRTVLRDLDIQVGAGEVVGLLGPNGAAKSTAIRLMSGEIAYGRCRVQLGHHDLTAQPTWQRVRLGLGLLPQQPSVVRQCTVRENLLLAAKVSGRTESEVDLSLIHISEPTRPY